ncbi:hypothetical protein B484DRAFT_434030, partial [Ochromonadaceae sp. CCMP2298]
MELASINPPLDDEPRVLICKLVNLLKDHYLQKFPPGLPKYDTPARYTKASSIFGGDRDLMAVFGILLRKAPSAELQRVGMELQLHGIKREVNLLVCFQGIPEDIHEAWLRRVKMAYQPVPTTTKQPRDKENDNPQEAPPAKKYRKEPHLKKPRQLQQLGKDLVQQVQVHLEEVAKTDVGKAAVLFAAGMHYQTQAERSKTRDQLKIEKTEQLAATQMVQHIAAAHVSGVARRLTHSELKRNISLLVPFFTRSQVNQLVFEASQHIPKRLWTLASYHAKEVGPNAVTDSAFALALRPRYRHHFNLQQLQFAVAFLYTDDNMQHVAYGTKRVRKSDGSIVVLPAATRRKPHAQLYEEYLGLCAARPHCTNSLHLTALHCAD